MSKKQTNLGLPEANSTKGFKRDSNGLVEGVDYVYTEQGFVDWRKMVKPEYLVTNRDRTSETDIAKLEDKDLLILLGGIKELAQIRGYSSVEYDVVSPSADYVVATCRIKWISNYETEGREVVFSAIGDASPENTTDFTKWYLAAMAENRAFVRCVRNFLKINIVGSDECGNVKKGRTKEKVGKEALTDPRSQLEELMKDKGVSFDILKERLTKEEFKNAESLSSLDDIPKLKVFELIARLKKASAKKTVTK